MTDAKKQMQVLMRRHKGKCAYCDRRVSTLLPPDHALRATREHLVPKSRGGSGKLSNLVLACRQCNEARGNQVPSEKTAPTAAKQRAMQAAAILAGVA